MTKIVERLDYIAAILEANADKFAVPDHIPAKVETIRQSRKLIEALTEALTEARVIVKADADACRAFRAEDETSEPERVLAAIDAALNLTRDGER